MKGFGQGLQRIGFEHIVFQNSFQKKFFAILGGMGPAMSVKDAIEGAVIGALTLHRMESIFLTNDHPKASSGGYLIWSSTFDCGVGERVLDLIEVSVNILKIRFSKFTKNY